MFPVAKAAGNFFRNFLSILKMCSVRKKSILFFLLLFLFTASATAQKFIALDKSGKVKRLHFYVNDKINIRLKDENFFRSGYIDSIEDTSFFFDSRNIPLSGIDAVLVYKNKNGHALVKDASNKLPAAGIVLLLLTGINSLISKTYPIIPPTVYIISGSMIAAGLLMHPLTYRVYQMKNHPLKIIDVTLTKDN
jgi:hypothetical protein